MAMKQNGKKVNLQKKLKEIKKRGGKKRKQKICIPDDMMICPFQSTPDEEVPCTHRCALFRQNKKRGFNCPLTELGPISWTLKGSPRKNDNRHNPNGYNY